MAKEIIICIPGMWESHQDLLHSIIEKNTGYVYAGKIIKALDSEKSAEIEECKADPSVGNAFRAMSCDRFSEDELKKIDNHKMVVYAICEGGNLDRVIDALNLGKALLQAGGLAIKIETTGVSHQKEEWLNFSSESIVDLFKAFVVILRDENRLLSCGMQNFGCPDGIISLDTEYPGYTLETFLIYLIDEQPEIIAGQTFTPEKDMEIFRINKRLSSEFYDREQIYFNPQDFWELSKL